ncbi:MAG TPA: DUF2793 domain-containing protein [Pyrinomonadaceae bacterium]|jgi:hypothetical protein|nr:DUF2793 domain-containing protein [Pyrinomonadaceae bacterium]
MAHDTQPTDILMRSTERNRYFYGKLMTVRDFLQEQNYFNSKRQVLNRLLFGSGIVCGLDVDKGGAGLSATQIEIDEGVAIDPLGREITVLRPDRFDLKELTFPSGQTTRRILICLAYNECQKEPVPSMKSSPCDEACESNRITESYTVEWDEWREAPENSLCEEWLNRKTIVSPEPTNVEIERSAPLWVRQGEAFEVAVKITARQNNVSAQLTELVNGGDLIEPTTTPPNPPVSSPAKQFPTPPVNLQAGEFFVYVYQVRPSNNAGTIVIRTGGGLPATESRVEVVTDAEANKREIAQRLKDCDAPVRMCVPIAEATVKISGTQITSITKLETRGMGRFRYSLERVSELMECIRENLLAEAGSPRPGNSFITFRDLENRQPQPVGPVANRGASFTVPRGDHTHALLLETESGLQFGDASRLRIDGNVGGAKIDFQRPVLGQDPVQPRHLVTKQYVDAQVAGLDWQESVRDKDLNAPPASRASGDRYLIISTTVQPSKPIPPRPVPPLPTRAGLTSPPDDEDASGGGRPPIDDEIIVRPPDPPTAPNPWKGHERQLATWNGSTWDYVMPDEGTAVFVEDEQIAYLFTKGTWSPFLAMPVVTAGDGLRANGAQLSVGRGAGLVVNPDDVTLDFEQAAPPHVSDRNSSGRANTVARGDHSHALPLAPNSGLEFVSFFRLEPAPPPIVEPVPPGDPRPTDPRLPIEETERTDRLDPRLPLEQVNPNIKNPEGGESRFDVLRPGGGRLTRGATSDAPAASDLEARVRPPSGTASFDINPELSSHLDVEDIQPLPLEPPPLPKRPTPTPGEIQTLRPTGLEIPQLPERPIDTGGIRPPVAPLPIEPPTGTLPPRPPVDPRPIPDPPIFVPPIIRPPGPPIIDPPEPPTRPPIDPRPVPFPPSQVRQLRVNGPVGGERIDFLNPVLGQDPVQPRHLVTKQYVDAKIAGLDWQESVKDKDRTLPPPLSQVGDRYLILRNIIIGPRPPDETPDDVPPRPIDEEVFHPVTDGGLKDESKPIPGPEAGTETPDIIVRPGKLPEETATGTIDSSVEISRTGATRDVNLSIPAGGGGGGRGGDDDSLAIPSPSNNPWLNHFNEITTWNGSAWEFTKPSEGTAVFVEDENTAYLFVDGKWIPFLASVQTPTLAGNGLRPDGNAISVGEGVGIQVSADQVSVNFGIDPPLPVGMRSDAGASYSVAHADHTHEIKLAPYGGLEFSNLRSTEAFLKRPWFSNEIGINGPVAGDRIDFLRQVSGQDPVEPRHLVTKQYVDAKIAGLDWQESVLDKDKTFPPDARAGDRYLIISAEFVYSNACPPNNIDEWLPHVGSIATWNGEEWEYTKPNEGMSVFVEDENRAYTFIDGKWTPFLGGNAPAPRTGIAAGPGLTPFRDERGAEGLAAQFLFDAPPPISRNPQPGFTDTIARGDHTHTLPLAKEGGIVFDEGGELRLEGFVTARELIFGNPVSGQEPTEPQHFATKKYVDAREQPNTINGGLKMTTGLFIFDLREPLTELVSNLINPRLGGGPICVVVGLEDKERGVFITQESGNFMGLGYMPITLSPEVIRERTDREGNALFRIWARASEKTEFPITNFAVRWWAYQPGEDLGLQFYNPKEDFDGPTF